MSTRRAIPWGPALTSASGAPPVPMGRPRSVVRLPATVTMPFEVSVDGIRQVEGLDFFLVGRLLVFERVLARQGRRFLRRAAGVCVRYEIGGRPRVADRLPVRHCD